MNQEVFPAYLHSHKTPLLDILGPRLYRPNFTTIDMKKT